MSLTLTYDATLSRVRAALTALGDAAEYRLERSTDQIRWTTVRGATAVKSVSGAATVDDYEFAADVQNFYRLRGPAVFDNYGRTVAAGGHGIATSGQTWFTSGTAADFSVSGSVGRIATTTINSLYYATVGVGSTDHTVHSAIACPVVPTGANVTLRVVGRWTSSSDYYETQVAINTAGQAFLSITKRVAGVLTTLTSTPQIGTHAAGNRWSIVLDVQGSTIQARAWNASTSTDPGGWQLTTTDTSLPTGSLAGHGCRRETGNTNGTQTITVDDFTATPEATIFAANITPDLGGMVWLKSVARPFLNRPITVVDFGDVTRQARRGVFNVVGRADPIAVAISDLRGGKQFDLQVLTDDLGSASDFDIVLASGDVLFIHVPADCPVPGGYVSVGDTAERRTARRSVRRVFTLPCTIVAPPAPDVVGVTYTYTGVANDYATYIAMIAANLTYADLAEHIGDAEDVITG